MKNKEFALACGRGNIAAINALIGGVDINCQDNNGVTPLMYAAQSGGLSAVKILIKSNVDLDIQDNEGRTALFYAACLRKVVILRELCNSGAKIDIPRNGGRTALMMASMRGSVEMTEILIASGAKIDINDKNHDTAYDIAARGGDFVINGETIPVMYALNKGVISDQDEDGNTALMRSCAENKESNVLFLYEKGADFDLKNNKGESALDILIKRPELSNVLQALKEKLILERMVEDVESIVLSM